MKIRTSFVTNSSSSSFVIAYKNLPEIDEGTLAKYPFLKNYEKLIENALFAEGDYETNSGEICKTKEELDECIIDNFGWRETDTIEKILEDEYFYKDTYNKAIKYLEEGFNILYKQVGYSDDCCLNMIKTLAEDENNFVILEGE